jgi:hypothetical protein
MREEIIEEHETRKSPSPPRIPERSTSRYSTASTVNTVGGTSGQERVLLYLDTPLSTTHTIDTSEPSPDLSDFLSFGSDENSTPRNSWAPSRNGKARSDSLALPVTHGDRFSPSTPPSAARLSAVGIGGEFGVKKRNVAGVRFVDDSKTVAQDFMLDDNEDGVIWGM